MSEFSLLSFRNDWTKSVPIVVNALEVNPHHLTLHFKEYSK